LQVDIEAQNINEVSRHPTHQAAECIFAYSFLLLSLVVTAIESSDYSPCDLFTSVSIPSTVILSLRALLRTLRTDMSREIRNSVVWSGWRAIERVVRSNERGLARALIVSLRAIAASFINF
jgi:hypothetical protein